MGGRRKRARTEISEADLDKFAGSSEEENINNDEDDSEEEVPMKPPKNITNPSIMHQQQKDYHADQDEADSSNSGSSSSSDEEEDKTGMANAMTKILGTFVPVSKPVVLSKTTTPLQRQQAKLQEEHKAAKEKRKQNRQERLSAMHVPMSVATTNHVTLSEELEQERRHRRVATRGVVALFNAIAQHQHKAEKKEEENQQTPTEEKPTKLTKHSFLDMIKSKAAEKPAEQKWNALSDDYMMTAKKNWDEEDSSDDEGAAVNDDDDKKKRQSRTMKVTG